MYGCKRILNQPPFLNKVYVYYPEKKVMEYYTETKLECYLENISVS